MNRKGRGRKRILWSKGLRVKLNPASVETSGEVGLADVEDPGRIKEKYLK